VTITDLIPALKGTGRRRAVDKVEELRRDIFKLLTQQAAADDAFVLLHQELTDARAKQAEAEEIVVAQLADIDELTAERDALAEELAALKRRFSAQLAAEANAHRIDVPPMVRDTTAIEDQATGPIDVSPLWAARDAGLLGPVTDPGRIGPDDDTQPIPAI
jgi:chromosome segregation ATPase